LRAWRADISFHARFSAFYVSVLLVTACSVTQLPKEPLTARGIILGVAQRTFTELDSIEIRTDDGQVVTFAVEGDVGLTPGHAREHMSFVEPVTVFYRDTERGPLAISITD